MTLARQLLYTLMLLLPGPSIAAGPVTVRFDEPRTEGAAVIAAVDPAVRIKIQATGGMAFGLMADDTAWLSCGASAIRTTFKIDEQVVAPMAPPLGPLAPGPDGKRRNGGQSTWAADSLHFTQVVEVVPSKAKPALKRALDAVVIRYVIENKSAKPRRVGVRVRIDTLCNGNDGALFAAPTTHPGQILDGIELRDKTLPEYVQILQNADLKNPGFVGHFALKLGQRLRGPERFVCSAHGAPDDGWNLQPQPANGDSDCALYWEPRVIPAGGTLEVGYGYGKGLASLPEAEGRVSVKLTGSFEPDKLFTIAAYVDEPCAGQALTLEMPPGLELVEGKAVQPVPLSATSATSLVLWKGRVRSLGAHALTVRSSTGIAHIHGFTVSRSEQKTGGE